MAQKLYRPQLDGVRSFCIIFTIFNHISGSAWWINGAVGVDVFFALSGWLITSLIFMEIETKGSVSIKNFYIRRIFRIIPLYIFTVVLYIFTVYLSRDPEKIDQLKNALPYLSTFNAEYRPDSAGNIFGHAWTLGIEEKFYLLWPLIMVLFGDRPVRALFVAIACSAVLLLFARNDAQTAMIVRGYVGLGFGTAGAVAVNRFPGMVNWLTRRPIGGLMLGLMLIPYLLSILVLRSPVWSVLISVMGTPLIASLWYCQDQAASRFLSNPLLAWLGRLTYGIYLVHVIVMHVAMTVLGKLHLPPNGWSLFAATYGLSILVAWGLHHTIESPMITISRRLTKGSPVTAPA